MAQPADQPHQRRFCAGIVVTLRCKFESVTLAAVSSVALQATVAALQRSMRELPFQSIKLFTHGPLPSDCSPLIERIAISPLNSRQAYSRFMLNDLARHIDTEHVLVVQWDGFVLDGSRWDNRFLDFDYVGAPWSQFADGMVVGNGGFSLRSKRLLEALAHGAYESDEPEDVLICRHLRRDLELAGMRFADRELAARFSYERTSPSGTELGFHGVFNLPEILDRKEMFDLLSGLEPGMINRNDSRTLLRKFLLRGDLGNARRLWRYMAG